MFSFAERRLLDEMSYCTLRTLRTLLQTQQCVQNTEIYPNTIVIAEMKKILIVGDMRFYVWVPGLQALSLRLYCVILQRDYLFEYDFSDVDDNLSDVQFLLLVF